MQFLRKYKQLSPDLLRIDAHALLILLHLYMNCSLLLEAQQCVLELSVEQKVKHLHFALLELLHQHEIMAFLVGCV